MTEWRKDLRNMYANRAICTWLIWWSIRIIKTNAVMNEFYVHERRFVMHVFENNKIWPSLSGWVQPQHIIMNGWNVARKKTLAASVFVICQTLPRIPTTVSNFSCGCANLPSPISNFHLSFMASFGFEGTAHQFYSIIGYFDRGNSTATRLISKAKAIIWLRSDIKAVV